MSPASPAPRYGVLVPVKAPSIAKSRLSELGEPARTALVTAFAADTVTAALETEVVGAVMVVTDDHLLAADLAELGAEVLPDGTADDLNESLRQAAAELARRHPELRPAALCADLPALRPRDLAAALQAMPDDRLGFVADAEEVGTTLVAAPGTALFTPAYGVGSRTAHLALGGVEVAGPAPDDLASLRRDVDTPVDLGRALELGVGPRTSWVCTSQRGIRDRYGPGVVHARADSS